MNLCSIATIYKEQGKFPEALELCHKSLATKEKVLGCEHPEVASTQDNMGIMLAAQGKHSKALKMHEKALKTRVAVFGPEHLDVAKTQNKCACLHVHTCLCVDMCTYAALRSST